MHYYINELEMELRQHARWFSAAALLRFNWPDLFSRSASGAVRGWFVQPSWPALRWQECLQAGLDLRRFTAVAPTQPTCFMAATSSAP